MQTMCSAAAAGAAFTIFTFQCISAEEAELCSEKQTSTKDGAILSAERRMQNPLLLFHNAIKLISQHISSFVFAAGDLI